MCVSPRVSSFVAQRAPVSINLCHHMWFLQCDCVLSLSWWLGRQHLMLAPRSSTVITEKHLLYAPATSTQPGVFNPCLQSLFNPLLKVTVQKSHQASRKPQKTIYTAYKSCCDACIKYSGRQIHAARACSAAHFCPVASFFLQFGADERRQTAESSLVRRQYLCWIK